MPSFCLLEFKDAQITVYFYSIVEGEFKIEETLITKP